ncbi:MAG: glycosyltransferase family 9 protein [Deltaproteobacteria bacterium]|nr:glycosyltransferase family 9 protein [Deltaproteobacteria bacterium]
MRPRTTKPEVEHLLVRAPNWVGDLVMATPVLEAALADPRFGRVSILVRSHLLDVLADGPCEDACISIAGRDHERGLYAELRAGSPAADAALLLTNSFGAAWRSFRAGIPIRAGTSLGGRGLLLTHSVVPPARDGRRVPIPTAHLLRDVAGLLGIQVPGLRPRLHVSEDVRRRTREILQRVGLEPGEPYVLCAPGAAFGAAKLWPPAHHAATLDALFESHGWKGVVTGAPSEDESIRAVVGACKHPAISLAEQPRDLASLKALVEGARLLLVGDSGPRWFAAAYETPCVTVMGPNFPELTASSLEWCEVVRMDLECAPCLRRTCPLGHHRCLVDLAPERAIAAAERLLRRKEAG